MPELIDINQVMTLLHVKSRATVYNRINRHELPKPATAPSVRPALWDKAAVIAASLGNPPSAAS